VYWFNAAKGRVRRRDPIDVSALLREQLFEAFERLFSLPRRSRSKAVLIFFEAAAGPGYWPLSAFCLGIRFWEQALFLYSPNLPGCGDAGFPERAAQENSQLLEISEGRAVLPVYGVTAR